MVKDANLDLFSGSFLNNYDVVIIVTHAGIGPLPGKKTEVVYLCTGEEESDQRSLSLAASSPAKYASLARGALSSILGGTKEYYGITGDWINLTADGGFPNSWIFAGGCETASRSDLCDALDRKSVV